jgi:hypothetical protein
VAERLDAGGRFAAAEQAGVVDVPGGQIRQRAAALLLVLDAHAARPARRQGGVAAAARLDAGLLIGADDVLVLTEGPAVDDALVQVQHSGGLGPERRVTREDPGVVPPRPDGILGQPAAQRRGRNVLDQPAGDDFLA